MSQTEDRGPVRFFIIFVLLGLTCFTGLVEVAAHSHHEVMLLVMALYFGGIGLTGIGVLGLVATFIQHILASRHKKARGA
jgi:hypothetical protein